MFGLKRSRRKRYYRRYSTINFTSRRYSEQSSLSLLIIMSASYCVVLELVPPGGEKTSKPRPRNRILIPLRGSFHDFQRAPFWWELHSRFLTWNQSMVQQLISDGNILSLFLKASPIGLIHNTTCRFRRTRSTKKLYIANGLESTFRFLSWTIFCIWLVKRIKQQFTQGTNFKGVVQKHHLTQTKK